MLDVSAEQHLAEETRIVEELWAAAKIRVELPLRMAQNFFNSHGPMSSQSNSRRSFHRFYLRSKAVLIQDTTIYGGYTTDVSRQGFGFLSPQELQLKSKWTIKLPNGSEYLLMVTRCRRVSDHCFVCGGRFAAQLHSHRSSSEEKAAEEAS